MIEIASARVYEIRLRVISTRRLANVHFVDPKVGDRDQAVAAYLASLFDPASVEILDCELVAEAGEIIPALPEVYQPSNRTSLGRLGRTQCLAGSYSVLGPKYREEEARRQKVAEEYSREVARETMEEFRLRQANKEKQA